MSLTPFDFVNSIMENKEDLTVVHGNEVLKQYAPYIINKALASCIDTLMFADEMNRFPFADKDVQYKYLLHAVPKKKRYTKWYKASKNEDVELMKEIYEVSNEKAYEILYLLSEEQLEELRKRRHKGGI